ncbi:MAG TPA: NUDIX domain-containing protein [Candidatus Angelobacter sp.]|nr:NUDIX domain-containing protein [Candidatus Angelobacter sp.]
MSNDTDERSDIGVLVGRFQTPDLHGAHKDLIGKVAGWHKKFLIVLGCSPTLVSRHNPLDFQARKLMINAHYSDLPVVPLMDCPDDHEWSKELDRRIREVFPVGSVTLYGGRDSFIPFYSGQFPCQEVEPSAYVAASGTLERRNASLEVRSSADWRAGVVYAAYNRYPQVFPAVDAAVVRESEDGIEILLAKKPGEKGYRLIGGFVDPQDASLNAAARREVAEEAHIEISAPEYIGSYLVDDWRYRNEVDKIMTTVFLARYVFGAIQPDDDIEELRWFACDSSFDFTGIVAAHRPLLAGVFAALSKCQEEKQLKEGTIHELPAPDR